MLCLRHHAQARVVSAAKEPDGGSIALEFDKAFGADALKMPWRLALSANVLAVLDPRESTKLHAFDISNGRELPVVYRGPQANYFRFPSSVSTDPEREGHLIVGDPNANRLTRLWVHSDSLVVESATPIVPKLETPFRSVTIRRADAIDLTGVFPHATIREIDSTGSVRRQFGPHVDSVQGVPLAVAATLTEQLVRWDARTREFVVLGLYSGLGSILDSTGNVRTRLKTPIALSTTYRVRYLGQATSLILEPEARMGYLDADVAGACVYALFSGRSLEEDGELASTARELHVFSLRDGGLVARYALPGAISAIAIGGSPVRLWASQWKPAPGIVATKLPTCGSDDAPRS